MRLQQTITSAIKSAMKAKDQVTLAALRAVKSEILLAQTKSGSETFLSDDEEIKILSKLVKQREDSAAIFSKQNRLDLASSELEQAEVIRKFLPEPLSKAALEAIVLKAITALEAKGMKDMGRVMEVVTKDVAGRADGKAISAIVKQKLVP